jgi:phosphohistidine phosphatase
MQLLLIRHALAFDPDPRRWPNDADRPLTTDGVMRARKAARGAKRITARPTLALTSSWVRARDTAALFAETAGWPRPIECAPLEPGGDPEGILAAVRHRCGKEGVAALFGHQPDLGALLALCLRGSAGGEAFELKKSAIACIAFEGSARAGAGTLSWLLPPKILRALRR